MTLLAPMTGYETDCIRSQIELYSPAAVYQVRHPVSTSLYDQSIIFLNVEKQCGYI